MNKKFSVNITRNANLAFSRFINSEKIAYSDEEVKVIIDGLKTNLTEMDVKNGVRVFITDLVHNKQVSDLTFGMNSKGEVVLPGF